jgi:hypothetical protein
MPQYLPHMPYFDCTLTAGKLPFSRIEFGRLCRSNRRPIRRRPRVPDVKREGDIPVGLTCLPTSAAEKMRLEIIVHAGVILAKTGDHILHVQPSVPVAEVVVAVSGICQPTIRWSLPAIPQPALGLQRRLVWGEVGSRRQSQKRVNERADCRHVLMGECLLF